LIEIDSLDKSIIELLFKDCRISYRTIAKDFAISVGTVHNRIQKLIKNGIIKKFETKFDFFKIGYSINAFIKLNNNNNELIDFIKNKFINNSFENQDIFIQQIKKSFSGRIIYLDIFFKDFCSIKKFENLLSEYNNLDFELNIVEDILDAKTQDKI